MKGEFIRGDGLVIPNNITNAGVAILAEAALRGVVTEFWLGLCKAVPVDDLTVADVIEPTLTSGYQRFQLERSIVGWPEDGTLNGEFYLESKQVTWNPIDPFSTPVSRLMLLDAQTDGTLIALSSAMPAEILFDEDTPLPSRQFRYRLYLR